MTNEELIYMLDGTPLKYEVEIDIMQVAINRIKEQSTRIKDLQSFIRDGEFNDAVDISDDCFKVILGCHQCGGTRGYGHNATCRKAALLKEEA